MLAASGTALMLALGCALFTGCSPKEEPKSASDTTMTDTTAVAGTPVSNAVDCSKLPPVSAPPISWVLPGDFSMPQQSVINAFAWTEFIALNWTADSTNPGRPDTTVGPDQFGMPGSSRPLVWETYKISSDVFRAGAMPPTPWGSGENIPAGLKGFTGGKANSALPLGAKLLFDISKVEGTQVLDLSEFGQASAGSPWLTAQNRNLTYYEKRLNKAEYDYIVSNKLYDALCQQAFAETNGIHLPYGIGTGNSYANDSYGAIEIKAAWMPLGPSDDASRYKTSLAWIVDPTTNTVKRVTVGLVGLHIIHKTQRGQTFTWATFEHVDNCPDVNQVKGGTATGRYSYYNPNCPGTDSMCTPNRQPTKGQPYTTPIQVVREFPIPSNSTNNIGCLNQAVWDAIRKVNPKSVFLNYELVNVVWPNNNQMTQGPTYTPLSQGDPQPKTIVANTTMETYVQTTLSCLDCHSFAATAGITDTVKVTRAKAPGSDSTNASDYSFLFGEAQMPSHATCKPKRHPATGAKNVEPFKK
jgi:hypothetical protein